jgi:cytochrome P450
VVLPSDVDSFLNAIVARLYREAQLPRTDPAVLASTAISDADTVHAVLSQPDIFQKNYSLIAALGDSRFNTNGVDWAARRDVTQRAYLTAGKSHNRPDIRGIYETCLADITTPSPAAIQRALLRASTRVFFKAFGCDIDADPLLDFFARARRYLKYLQYHSWQQPTHQEAAALRNDRDALLADYEAEIARAPALAALMQSFRERMTSERFNPFEELLMNFFAGIETTAATLGFAIDRLGVDERVQRRLYDETTSDVTDYLDCFINETMRYFPPIPFVVRQAARDIAVNGTTFKEGQTLVLSIIGVHHDERHWDRPFVFHTSRPAFLNGDYNRRAFIPFLSGPRMCGGATLAKLELIEGLGAFIRAFQVMRQGDDIAFDYGLALRASSWDLVTINRR